MYHSHTHTSTCTNHTNSTLTNINCAIYNENGCGDVGGDVSGVEKVAHNINLVDYYKFAFMGQLCSRWQSKNRTERMIKR